MPARPLITHSGVRSNTWRKKARQARLLGTWCAPQEAAIQTPAEYQGATYEKYIPMWKYSVRSAILKNVVAIVGFGQSLKQTEAGQRFKSVQNMNAV
jgi:hypothetical protein